MFIIMLQITESAGDVNMLRFIHETIKQTNLNFIKKPTNKL